MAETISVNNMYATIVARMKEFEKLCNDDINEVAKEVAKDTSNYLKQTSPKQTGNYAKGWTYGMVSGKALIYNKSHGGLTHLLEFGHAIKNGGRIPSTSRQKTEAQAHIKPAEDKAIADFETKLKRKLSEHG